MLIQATAEDIKKCGELVYQLALDPARSCYPTYCDGIKTKFDFFKAAEDALIRETSELLLFCDDGEVAGWISYFWIPEDKYLQLDGFWIDHGTEQALEELLERLETNFAGYTAYFGYPGENHAATSFLAAHGFVCIEQAWNHSFFFGGKVPEEDGSPIERISRQNFDRFRAIYHPELDTYWTADRILETVDDWIIFVYQQEGAPIAAMFSTGRGGHYEIFGTEFADGAFQETAFRVLLAATLAECNEQKASYMTFFCKEREQKIVGELGFQCVGQYVLYLKTLGAG